MIESLIAAGLTVLGIVFFIGGSVGLLRFPDFFCRLHALTKADNLGLGLIACARLLQAVSPAEALQIFGIWILVLASSTTAAYRMANRRSGKRTDP